MQILLPENINVKSFPIFSHNSLWTKKSPEELWQKLIDAKNWPNWYKNSHDVKLLSGNNLQKNTEFAWKTFGLNVQSKVLIYNYPFDIGWDAKEIFGWQGFHGWKFVPENNGTRIITEEIQKGIGDFLVKNLVKNMLLKGHQLWLENLIKNDV